MTFTSIWQDVTFLFDATGVQYNNIRSHALTSHKLEFQKAQEKREKYWRRTPGVDDEESTGVDNQELTSAGVEDEQLPSAGAVDEQLQPVGVDDQ